MDTKFQTSFIPKNPILVDKSTTRYGGCSSVFTLISIIIFTLSVAGAAFSFIWNQILTKNQKSYREELIKAKENFNTVLIDDLIKTEAKINISKQLLKKHLAVSEVFDIINRLTSDGIRFDSFDFSSSGIATDGLKITMKGYGNNLSAVAWQSDVLGQSETYGKNVTLINPILTDLILDTSGKVAFTFSAMLKSSDVSYENAFPKASVDNPTP